MSSDSTHSEGPLLLQQEAALFMSEISLDQTPYVLTLNATLPPQISRKQVQGLVYALMTRHTGLRSILVSEFDGVHSRQQVGPPSVQLDRVDIPDLSAIVSDRRRVGIETSSGYPVEAIIAVGQGASQLVLLVHHAAADAWAMGIIRRDLSMLLQGMALKPLLPSSQPVQLAQSQRHNAERLEGATNWWAENARSLPPHTVVRPKPTTEAEPSRFLSALLRETVALPTDLKTRFKSTASMLFTAAYAWFLSGISAADNVGLQYFLGNRLAMNRRETVANFALNGPFALDLSGDPQFGDTVAAVRAFMANAWQYPDHDSIEVMDRKYRASATRRTQLPTINFFPAALMKNISAFKADSDVDADDVIWEPSVASDVLGLSIFEVPGGFKVHVTFDTTLLSRTDIRWLLRGFGALWALLERGNLTMGAALEELGCTAPSYPSGWEKVGGVWCDTQAFAQCVRAGVDLHTQQLRDTFLHALGAARPELRLDENSSFFELGFSVRDLPKLGRSLRSRGIQLPLTDLLGGLPLRMLKLQSPTSVETAPK